MKIKPVRGTNDYLPYEVQIRDYLQTKILETYQNHGFERISTPIMESIENLNKSEGGDNLNLIFKIMQRGDKLQSALEEKNYDDLADMGLRYDLTLPLARYYANNKDKLLMPFKSIQIDRAFRAERPQKGRFREFMQCDIDILGSDSISCEIELIDTTAKALLNIGLNDFAIRINDRRILRSSLLNAGFLPEELDGVCIVFDKLDKIGIDGIKTELTEKEYSKAAIDNFMELLNKMPLSFEDVKQYCNDESAIHDIGFILKTVADISAGAYDIRFDISLVRGQGYYTGTVFEIESNKFKGAVGGGGRYDGLIGKFTNDNIPAVGFSIGFERISSILIESGYKIPEKKKLVAVIYNEEEIKTAFEESNELRQQYDVRLFLRPKKLGKLLDKLEGQGVYGYFVAGESDGVKVLGLGTI